MSTAFRTALPRPLVLPPSSRRRRLAWLVAAGSLPGALWCALWLSINTGPGLLATNPTTTLSWAHYLRTLFPLVVLALAGLALLARASLAQDLVRLPAALRPWFLYGLLALAAGLTGPRPTDASYWALSYLAPFLVVWLLLQAPTDEDRLARARTLNHLTWVVAGLLLVLLVWIARDHLLVQGRTGLTGYGIVNRVDPVAGIGIARASGMARFAAVPALLGFAWACTTRGWVRLFWAAVTLAGALLVYFMQSRGATVGFVAAIAFAMIYLGRHTRVLGVPLLGCVAFALLAGAAPDSASDRIVRHLVRDESVPVFANMPGRTRDWSIAWSKIQESPLWGWGLQADRHLLGFHVHNSHLYAGLTAGLAGLLLFLAGLVRGWRLLLRALRQANVDRLGERATLVQIGCLLTFFTVRGIPEVSGPMYGIDLLLLVPALAWLQAFDHSRHAGAPAPGFALARGKQASPAHHGTGRVR